MALGMDLALSIRGLVLYDYYPNYKLSLYQVEIIMTQETFMQLKLFFIVSKNRYHAFDKYFLIREEKRGAAAVLIQ